jgi:hypothetical protein
MFPDDGKARHDKMVELMTRMKLKKQQTRVPKKQSPSAGQLLDQKLAITDQQIDALVYELHGLSTEEIRIVEGREVIDRTMREVSRPRSLFLPREKA